MVVRHRWLTVVGSLGFGLVYAGAVLWEPGQRIDDAIFATTLQLADGPVGTVLPWVARGFLPVALVVPVFLCAVGTPQPRRGRRIGATGILVVGAVVVSRLLRDPILWRPIYGEGYGYPTNTFPSTHMTLVVGLAVALWLLVPRRTGWLATVLVLVVLLAMVGNVVGHAHRPSDTLGSIFLVGAVTGFVCGITRPDAPASG